MDDAVERLTFIPRSPESTRRGIRPSYPESPVFSMPWWTEEDFGESGSYEWFSVNEGSEEVARFMLEARDSLSARFGLAVPDDGFLEVVFLEVSSARRHSGIATRTIRQLEVAYRGSSLMAISQDGNSDGFWDSIGWQRHEHPVLGKSRPIYLASTQSKH